MGTMESAGALPLLELTVVAVVPWTEPGKLLSDGHQANKNKLQLVKPDCKDGYLGDGHAGG